MLEHCRGIIAGQGWGGDSGNDDRSRDRRPWEQQAGLEGCPEAVELQPRMSSEVGQAELRVRGEMRRDKARQDCSWEG